MHLLKRIVIGILTLEAQLVLYRCTPKIIAVTGSVGKTTTKDAIFSALSGSKLHVRKSEKSFNSDIGVPLAILGLENAWKNPLLWMKNILKGLQVALTPDAYPEWLVLEVGADRPGDIDRIAKWLKPDIAVITGVPEIPVHVEYFPSPESLAREKRSLAVYIKRGGKLVINGDDSRMVEMCADFRGMMVKYGFESGNAFRGADLVVEFSEDKKPLGIVFRIEHAGSSVPLSIRGALGRPRAYATLAALAVAEAAGVDPVSAAQGLTSWQPPPGRMRIIEGVNGSTIIDDTYNSSPAAALAALDALKDMKGKRRIALLGDMLELGKYSAEAHRNVGRRAAEVAKMLWTVGFRSRVMADSARDFGFKDEDVRQYEQTEALRAGEELKPLLKKNDVVLIKGSQSMRMERAVEALMADPARASDLLVRQDPEWKSR